MEAATTTWINRKEALKILGITDGGLMQKLITDKRFRTKKEGARRFFDQASVEEVLAERSKASEPVHTVPHVDEQWVSAAEALKIIGRERHSALNHATKAGRLERKKQEGVFVYRVIDLLALRERLQQSKRAPPSPRKKKASIEQVNEVLVADHDASLDARIVDLIAYMRGRVPNLHTITIHVAEMRCEVEQRVVNSVNLSRIA